MFITTQDIVNFRNPTAEVLPVEKDFTDKSKYTVKVNLMDLNFCPPTMSSFDPCLAEICKLKLKDFINHLASESVPSDVQPFLARAYLIDLSKKMEESAL